MQPARLPLQFPAFYLVAALCWLLFVEIGTAAWYRVHETNLVSAARWSVRWPEQSPNFRKLKIDPEIRGVLRFDEGEAAAWTLTSPISSENAGEPRASGTQVNGSRENTISCLLFVFRWEPGKNSALLANLHRPDVCLPASGWKQVADDGVRNYPVSGSFELPFRHFEFQRAFGDSRRRQRTHFIVYRKIALLDHPRNRRARTRPGCQEAAPNGREPNVFAR